MIHSMIHSTTLQRSTGIRPVLQDLSTRSLRSDRELAICACALLLLLLLLLPADGAIALIKEERAPLLRQYDAH